VARVVGEHFVGEADFAVGEFDSAKDIGMDRGYKSRQKQYRAESKPKGQHFCSFVRVHFITSRKFWFFPQDGAQVLYELALCQGGALVSESAVSEREIVPRRVLGEPRFGPARQYPNARPRVFTLCLQLLIYPLLDAPIQAGAQHMHPPMGAKADYCSYYIDQNAVRQGHILKII
jgi:hypothetical protein